MNNIRYLLSAIAAAMMAAAEVFKDYADNTPESDEDGVVIDSAITSAIVGAAVGELDSSGLPHHPSIHASTKTKKADGTWTKRKGVSDVDYNKVVGELRLTHPAPQQAAAPAAAPAAPVIKVPGAPAKLTLAPPAKTAYTELCEWLAASEAAGLFTGQWVNDTLGEHGTSIAALAADQELSKAWLASFKGAVGQE